MCGTRCGLLGSAIAPEHGLGVFASWGATAAHRSPLLTKGRISGLCRGIACRLWLKCCTLFSFMYFSRRAPVTLQRTIPALMQVLSRRRDGQALPLEVPSSLEAVAQVRWLWGGQEAGTAGLGR